MTPGIARQAWSPLLPVLMALALGGCATGPSALPADLAIDGVNVVDTRTGQVRADQTILIAGGRVLGVRPTGSGGEPAARRIDGRGHYAIPGLWDAHIHLLVNDAEAARGKAKTLLSYGITHVRDMGSSRAALAAWRQMEPVDDAPVIRAGGPMFWTFELPYGDPSEKQILTDPADTEAAVQTVAAAGADFIKVYAGFTPDRLPRLMQAARAAGLPVAGHAQPGSAIDRQAELGLTTVEHLEFQTFAGCGPDPEAYFERTIAARFQNTGESLPAIFVAFVDAVDRATCVAMLRRAADAGLFMTPTLTATLLPPANARTLLEQLPPGQTEGCRSYLTPFEGAGQAAEAAYVAAGHHLMAMVREAGVPILAGSDSPVFCGRPGETLLLELQLLHDAGLSPLQVLQAATLNPARAFGASDRAGAIEAGLDADILLLEENPLETLSAYSRPTGLFTRGLWRDEAALMRLRRPAPD